MTKQIQIINGPNLNLLGTRQPEIYGKSTLNDIEQNCVSIAIKNNLDLNFVQSNHEGELVDIIQRAEEKFDGIIINPGAFGHTSVALLDALNNYKGPVLEVHISNIHKREEFRHKSFVSLRADGVICGFGVGGYEIALSHIVTLLE